MNFWKIKKKTVYSQNHLSPNSPHLHSTGKTSLIKKINKQTKINK